MHAFRLLAIALAMLVPSQVLPQVKLPGPFFWLDPAFAQIARSTVASATSTISSMASGLATGAARAGRFCVRPRSARACDFRGGVNAYEAARSAVEPKYSLRKTKSPTLFEVIDAIGTVVDILEVLDRSADPSIDQLPQAAPPPSANSVVVHNRTGLSLQWRVIGDGCHWMSLNHPANAWAHIHCPTTRRFVAEIDMQGPLYNQVITRQYELPTDVEYELHTQAGTYGNWMFVPVAR